MRKKALLVSARAGAMGPVVHLGDGDWEIVSHPHIEVTGDGLSEDEANGVLKVKGKAKVRTFVREDYKGPPIHLDAVQVKVGSR